VDTAYVWAVPFPGSTVGMSTPARRALASMDGSLIGRSEEAGTWICR